MLAAASPNIGSVSPQPVDANPLDPAFKPKGIPRNELQDFRLSSPA